MVGICLCVWLALLVAGDTPIGRSMRHWLVEWPAARLARIHRGAVLTWLVLAAIGAACFWLLEDEGLRLFTMALPELAGMVTAFEVGALVDALAVGVLAASTMRLGAMKSRVLRHVPTRRRAKRARRAASRPRVHAANDDDGAAPLAA